MQTELYAPALWYRVTSEAKDAICNGCGAANAKFDFVPDTLWGLSITEACRRHDFMYYFGETIEDKAEADRVFLNNMLRLVEADNTWLGRILKMFRRRRALEYYECVTAFGGPAYWADKNEPI